MQLAARCNPCRKRLVIALKLEYDQLLSSCAFNSNLRPYRMAASQGDSVGWGRLTPG